MVKVIKVALKKKPNLLGLFDKYIHRIVSKQVVYPKQHNAQGNIIECLVARLDELYGIDNWDENDAFQYARLLGISEGELFNEFSLMFHDSHANDDNLSVDEYGNDDITYPTEYDYFDYNSQDTDYKEIWYYPDYHDDTDRLEFNSLKEFSDYCSEEGIYVPPYMGELLRYQSVSHCCLNGTSKEHGQLELTVDDSYGNMFYTACTVSEARELSQ